MEEDEIEDAKMLPNDDRNRMWTRREIFHLLNLYRGSPALWDPNDPMYTNRLKREDSLQEIARCMNIDVEEIRRKMKSLTSAYRREKSKIGKSRMVGKAHAFTTWFAYEAMSFLNERNALASSLDVIGEEVSKDAAGLPFPLPAVDGNVTILPDKDSGKAEIKTEPSPRPVRKVFNYSPFKKRIKKAAQMKDLRVGQGLWRPAPKRSAQTGALTSAIGSSTVDDESSVFAKFVEVKLRSYSPYIRRELTYRINNLFHDADVGKLNPNAKFNPFQAEVNGAAVNPPYDVLITPSTSASETVNCYSDSGD